MMDDTKSKSAISLISKSKTKMLSSSKSTESLYSANSSKNSAVSQVYKRKAAVNLKMGGNSRQKNSLTSVSEIKQRVMSARRLRMKTLQNQLNDAEMHITELANENRILRTLHKRQDQALSKYENSNAELPQLLHSHAEEIRTWQAKFKALQTQNRELTQKLKQRDGAMLMLNDENKHLTQLNNDKHLEEREYLKERLKLLENELQEKDNEIKLLSRRLQLESKSFKQQLHSEQTKYKDIRLRLEKTRTELSGQPPPSHNKLALEMPDKLIKGIPKSLLQPTNKFKKPSENKIVVDESIIKPLEDDFLKPIQSALKNVSNPLSLSTKIIPKSDRARSNRSNPKTPRAKNELAEAIKMGISTLSETNNYEDEDDPDLKGFFRTNDELDNYDDTFFDGFDDVDENDVIISTDYANNAKDDIKSLRRKISKDYEERESFLDTHCRESEIPKREPKQIIDAKKKVSLLAALKAIDENNVKDEDLA